MTLLAFKCLGIAWVLVILGFGAWIGWQVFLSWLGERRPRRERRDDVQIAHDRAAQWIASNR